MTGSPLSSNNSNSSMSTDFRTTPSAPRAQSAAHVPPQGPTSTKKNTDKSAWGPQLWHSMHMIALNYPDRPSPSDKLNYKLFFESLKDVLPCLACADNYAEHLQELPIDRYLDSAGNLFAWTVHVHNIVNESQGKRKVSVQEALDYYASYRGPAASSASSSLSLKDNNMSMSLNDSNAPHGGSPTRMDAAKDMLATWLMLLVTALIALTILVLSWYAFVHIKKMRR